MATIEDVADRAGVSVATVSRALRGLPNVAPATRARVEDAARALHYIADPHASRLAARRSATVGVVVPMLSSWYHSQVFAGIESVLAPAGMDTLPYVLPTADARARFIETRPFRKRVDGLVIVDIPFDDDDVEELLGTDLVVAAVGIDTDAVPALVIDDRAAARTAVTHLVDLGHRRIGLLGDGQGQAFRFRVPARRRQGYEDALTAADIPIADELIVPAAFTLEGGTEAMRRLLALSERPTGVFAMSDEIAIGALRAIDDAGLSVPEELSVVGFDDHDVAASLGLTTIRQDVPAHGARAAEVVLTMLRPESRPDTGPDIGGPMRTELVVRDTTAAPVGGADRERGPGA